MNLIDLGEPVKRLPDAPPAPEMFFGRAWWNAGNGQGWFKSSPLYTKQAQAEQWLSELAAGWVRKEVFRIPGDVK